MWKEQEDGDRINVARAREAIAANPQLVATACPFCLLMFDEALQIEGKQDAVKVKDIAQIAEKLLGRRNP
jgi:Fe-S oxidoreductase